MTKAKLTDKDWVVDSGGIGGYELAASISRMIERRVSIGAVDRIALQSVNFALRWLLSPRKNDDLSVELRPEGIKITLVPGLVETTIPWSRAGAGFGSLGGDDNKKDILEKRLERAFKRWLKKERRFCE